MKESTIRAFSTLALALFLLPGRPVSGGAPGPVQAVAEKVRRALDGDDGEQIFGLFGPSMRAALPLAKTRDFVHGVHISKGRIRKMELLKSSGRSAIYELEAAGGKWRFSLDLDPEGRIAGMRLTEPPPLPPAVVASTLALGLPFGGQWTVVWGGETEEQNIHVPHASQRRAADLVKTGREGRSFRTDGKTNPDYFAYGQPVLSVADGEVIAVVDGVPDNNPPAMNPYMAPGNTVIVKHTSNLYSVYCHLKPGSPRVAIGTRVARGQILGLCGNSGNSSEPHLHFQLQDGPLFEASWGVEAVFDQVHITRDGKTRSVPDYRFRQGDRVSGRHPRR